MSVYKKSCSIDMWIREEKKLKKLFLIFTFLITFILSSNHVLAANNLHTITLEKTDTGYNVILGTDKLAKVVKKTPADNELIMELSGISSAETVNAIYKGSNNIDGLVIEHPAQDKLKINISAEGIKNSTVMIEPIDGATTIVGDTFPVDKALWVVFGAALFFVIFKISKDIEDDEKLPVKKDIKEREIEMYRQFKHDFTTNPVSFNNDYKMKKIMKKIDRKIDERLMSTIK